MKKCSKCKTVQPLSEFYRNLNMDDGKAGNCKTCMKATAKKWRAENRERHLQMMRNWYAENKDVKNYKDRLWKALNPDKDAASWAKRRAARRQAVPKWANNERIAEFYKAADFLGMVTGEWYHVDHIVPLTHKLVCGLHWEGNLQVITAVDNLKKFNTFVV